MIHPRSPTSFTSDILSSIVGRRETQRTLIANLTVLYSVAFSNPKNRLPMIAQIFEFIGNHLILVGMFVFLLIAFFVHEARRSGATVSTSVLVNLINKEDAMVLDVRDSKEYREGHIAGSLNIPYTSFDKRSTELGEFKEKPLVVVCKIGQHSGTVGRKLGQLGFEDVRRLSGGMTEWSSAGLPVVKGKS